MDSKRCADCGETKPISEFFVEVRRKDGHGAYCKKCKTARKNASNKKQRVARPDFSALESERKARWRARHPDRARVADKRNAEKLKVAGPQRDRLRDWYYRRRFGVTLEQYTAMLNEQGGCCLICGFVPIDEATNYRRKFLSVDHDHATGAVRSLLCHRCNSGLGHFNDDPALLSRAIEYLSR